MENEAFRPLTDEEKMAHFPSGVFASGEALFYDTSQSGVFLPINETYPHPSGFISESGIYATYDKNLGSGSSESTFSMNGLVSHFSNGNASITELIARGITNFSIFNPYIHYYSVEQPTGTVVPYPAGTPSSGVVKKPVYIDYGFGIGSSGYYPQYPTGEGGTYLRTSRESWNVETGGYGPPVQPTWPPPSGEHSGTGSGLQS